MTRGHNLAARQKSTPTNGEPVTTPDQPDGEDLAVVPHPVAPTPQTPTLLEVVMKAIRNARGDGLEGEARAAIGAITRCHGGDA